MTDLTTLAAVKAYASVGTDANDAMLSALITGYSDLVRAYTGRDFTLQSYLQSFDGRNSAMLILPQWPVVAVTAVLVDGRAIPSQASFGVSGYRFTDTAIVLDGYRFARGLGNVQVAWTAGYAAVPPAISQALNEMVALRYALRTSQGVASKSLAGETITFTQRDMPAAAKTVLDQFKAVVA